MVRQRYRRGSINSINAPDEKQRSSCKTSIPVKDSFARPWRDLERNHWSRRNFSLHTNFLTWLELAVDDSLTAYLYIPR